RRLFVERVRVGQALLTVRERGRRTGAVHRDRSAGNLRGQAETQGTLFRSRRGVLRFLFRAPEIHRTRPFGELHETPILPSPEAEARRRAAASKSLGLQD